MNEQRTKILYVTDLRLYSYVTLWACIYVWVSCRCSYVTLWACMYVWVSCRYSYVTLWACMYGYHVDVSI
jgi:hypothetical protein